jgi:ribosomal protein S8
MSQTNKHQQLNSFYVHGIPQLNGIRKQAYFNKEIKRRIVVNLYQYICEINLFNKQLKSVFLFLTNNRIIVFVNYLKQLALIYNYYVVTSGALVKIKALMRQNLIMLTYLRYSFVYGRAFEKIQVISRPSRLIFLRYRKMIKVLYPNRINIRIFFLIYCKYGLLSALEIKILGIGGQLFCKII